MKSCVRVISSVMISVCALMPLAFETMAQDGAPAGREARASSIRRQVVQQVQALSAQGKRAEARALLEKALEIAPDVPTFIGMMATLDAEDGNFDAALEMLNSALAKHPASPQLLAAKVRVYGLIEPQNDDDRAKIEAELREIETLALSMSEAEKKSILAMLAAAWIHLENQNAELGLKVFAARNRGVETVSEISRNAISQLASAGERDKALRCADAIFDETDAKDWAWLGAVAGTARDWPRAEAAFRKVTEMTPEDPRGWVGLLQALKAQSLPVSQDEFLTQVVAAVPAEESPLCLAKVWQLFGDARKAQSLFLEALAKKPDSLEILQAVSQFYMCTSRPELAIPHLEKMETLVSENPRLSPAMKAKQLAWIRESLESVRSR